MKNKQRVSNDKLRECCVKWSARKSETPSGWFIEDDGRGVWSDGAPSTCSKEDADAIIGAFWDLRDCREAYRELQGILGRELLKSKVKSIIKYNALVKEVLDIDEYDSQSYDVYELKKSLREDGDDNDKA